jgi:hypothetical protein
LDQCCNRKLGKLVNKQNVLTMFFYFINYNIIIVQVRYITIETRGCLYWI